MSENEISFKVVRRTDVGALILAHATLNMSGTFTKADGSQRDMYFRRAVNKGVKGTGKGVPDADEQVASGVLRVYDNSVKGWRSFNINTATRLKFRGKNYLVVDDIAGLPGRIAVLQPDGSVEIES